MTPTRSSKRGPDRIHERPPDPQEAADRPLEPKSRPGPERGLSRPVGEPDPAAIGDPYDPDAELMEPPPPGEHPGPGPEPAREGLS